MRDCRLNYSGCQNKEVGVYSLTTDCNLTIPCPAAQWRAYDLLRKEKVITDIDTLKGDPSAVM
jgi:hypothetical protein